MNEQDFEITDWSDTRLTQMNNGRPRYVVVMFAPCGKLVTYEPAHNPDSDDLMYHFTFGTDKAGVFLNEVEAYNALYGTSFTDSDFKHYANLRN